MILRLSQQLARKVKVSHLSQLPEALNPLVDFSAHIFNVSRTRYILVSNTRSLYSAVMFAKGINDHHALVVGTLRSMADMLAADGFPTVFQERIAPGSGRVEFGQALNRSVTGCMNELIMMAMLVLEDTPGELVNAACQVNNLLLSTLAAPDSKYYGTPRAALRRLLETPCYLN